MSGISKRTTGTTAAPTLTPVVGVRAAAEAKTVVRSAVLSGCGTYRYELRRVWADGPLCGWIMLNPSTADAARDDPTIRRCADFARRWGYSGIVVRNVHALRATDPRELATHPDPHGPDNNRHLHRAALDPITVCAWGASVSGEDVLDLLTTAHARLRHLGLTRAGRPRHPLYMPATTKPIPWSPR